MTAFADWASASGVVPAFLDGPWGRRWAQALGTLKDATMEAARQAARCRYVSTCPPDALALHGEARGWGQAPGETVDEYRARLGLTWHLAQWAGTRQGMLDAFASIGMTNVEVYESSITPGWGRNADLAHCGWINVVIRHPHPFGDDFASYYGDGSTWGGGQQWGFNGDPRLLELVRRLVRKMKPAHCVTEWIAVVLNGDVKLTGASTDGDPDTAAKVGYLSP